MTLARSDNPPSAARPGFASPADAVAAMIARVAPVGTERVGLFEAFGRVLAEPVATDRPSPAADVSAMDGFAIRTAGLAAGRFAIVGEAWIGQAPPRLDDPRGVIRIVTGAPLPPGADAVIKREDVTESDATVDIKHTVVSSLRPGVHIRRQGENAPAGHTTVEPGREIDAVVSSALAAFGRASPLVHRRLRIGILTTGDELLGPASSPSPWQLRDSNGPALIALLTGKPWIKPLPHQWAGDDPHEIAAALSGLLSQSDALLITGGVSMGDRDHVPAAIASVGAETLFHKIPQRPGRPILGAITRDGRPILALPGNPLSVMVTARRMAFPILERLAGLTRPRPPMPILLDTPGDQKIDLWWHRLVRIASPGRATPVEGRGSGDIIAAAASDGFVEVPPGQKGPGPWPFYPWG